MFHIVWICLSLAMAPSASFEDDAVAEGAVVQSPLGTALDEYLARGSRFGFSGSVLVVREGKVILNKGYGLADRTARVPNTPATLFDVGSLAKSFAAVAVLRLEEQRKLRTEDSIGKHLLGVPPDKSAVTVYHLLTHTSGLAAQGPAPHVDPTDRDGVVRALLAPPVEAAPGTRLRYNNVNYFLLAAIVERASGTSFESYLKENVFCPAGMVRTGFSRDRDVPAARTAHGYTMTGLDAGPAQILPYHWLFRGATGVLSSVEDLERWDRALRADGVLTAASRKKLFRPILGGFACGWQIGRSPRGTPAIGHDGSTFCFESAFLRFPAEPALVIVLCNNLGISQLVKRDVVSALFDRPFTKPPRAIRIAPARLKSYEGVYRSASPKQFRFTIVDQELESDYFLPARIWYAPETETRFVTFDWVESKEYRLDFQVADNGSVRGFVLHGFGPDQVFTKQPTR